MPPTSPRASAATEPTRTPVPNRTWPEREEDVVEHGLDRGGEDDNTFPLPKLRLQVHDLTHPGASRFLSAVDAATKLSQSAQSVLCLLYVSPCRRGLGDCSEAGTPSGTCRYQPPPTRSVTLVLEAMDGVAYTKGSDLDDDHKEIHFSLDYIKGIKKAPEGAEGDVTGAYEIQGVLVHELVHCFQYNGQGACPGGLVEGIADWVRLKARLRPSHWQKFAIPDSWDQGYEKTAYFLDWLEGKFGKGSVRNINEELRVRKYEHSKFWVDLFGREIESIWEDYVQTLKHKDE